ncbi:predicted protein [Botrytis cinerea T4]|uniref:Uncharacterized protein n=1 Tax=Botryotinia fuckeliana (strain T4) TaxID=999810 RepID=G2Y7Z0_BOTF4|nr:predicted protein [Botrytis cinerea T4]
MQHAFRRTALTVKSAASERTKDVRRSTLTKVCSQKDSLCQDLVSKLKHLSLNGSTGDRDLALLWQAEPYRVPRGGSIDRPRRSNTKPTDTSSIK